MRTTVKLWSLSLVAVVVTVGSATSAVADNGYDGRIKDAVALEESCGNIVQQAPLSPGGSAQGPGSAPQVPVPPQTPAQEAGRNQVICQIGEENVVVNYAPRTETVTADSGAVDQVLLALISLITPAPATT